MDTTDNIMTTAKELLVAQEIRDTALETYTTADAEVMRLKELMAAQLGLNSRTPTSRNTPDSLAAKERAWAKDNGMNVPARGRVPKAVKEAYATAVLAKAAEGGSET